MKHALGLLCLIAAIGVCRADEASFKLRTPYVGNLFYVGFPVELTLSTPDEAKGWVLWTVTDIDGKRVDGSRFPVKKETKFQPKVESPGIYYVSCKLQGGDTPIARTSFALIRKLFLPERRNEPFGINGGALFHITLDEIKTIGKTRLDLCERLGVPWGRNDFWWGRIEPTEGRFEWFQAEAAVRMYESHTLDKPVWITEIGWPTGKKWMTEEEQARMLVRVFTLCLGEGVQRLFYYNSEDYAPYDSEGWDGRTGLFDAGGIPKAAASAFNEMMYQLKGMRFAGNVYLRKNVYGRLFAKGNDQTLVVWTIEPEPVEIEMGTDTPGFHVTDMFGRESVVKAADGILKLKVTGRPQYLKMRSPGLLPQAGLDFHAERFTRGGTKDVEVILKGLAMSVVSKVRLEVPSGWSVTPAEMDVKPEKDGAVCRFRVTVPVSVAAGEYEMAAVSVEGVPVTVTKPVIVEEPVKLTVSPPSYLNRERTELMVSIGNLMDTPLGGTLSVSSSESLLGTMEAKSIAPGQTRSLRLYISPKDAEPGGPYPIHVECDIGEVNADGGIVLDLAGVYKPKSPVQVDGKLSDWAGVETIFDSQARNHVDLAGKWAGDKDHSARAWVAWDADWLYIAVDVTDDKNVWPTSTEVWKWDSLQLAFDPANDATGGGYDGNDFELEIGKVNGQDRVIAGVARAGADISGARVAIIGKPSGGAVYELAIPAKALSRQGFQPHKLIGFSLLVNDNDGAGRKSFLELTPGIGVGKDPSAFKDLWLLE